MLLTAVAVLMVAGCGGQGAARGSRAARLWGIASWPAGKKPAPPFRLADQSGRAVSLSGKRGRVVILTFLDSRCRKLCPVTGVQLGRTLQQLPTRTPVSLLVVSVDPWSDTPGSVRTQARRWHWRGDWHWLLGSRAQLAAVWRAYGIDVKRTPSDIEHSNAIYLIDRHGDERVGLAAPFPARPVARDILELSHP